MQASGVASRHEHTVAVRVASMGFGDFESCFTWNYWSLLKRAILAIWQNYNRNNIVG